MDTERATAAPRLPHPTEGFRTLAEEHRTRLSEIRERNRRRRLRYLMYLNVLDLAYLLSRAFEGRPLEWGLPRLGPDAMLWIFPGLIPLMTGAMIAMPPTNAKAPHIR